jgi:hypothetical protein
MLYFDGKAPQKLCYHHSYPGNYQHLLNSFVGGEGIFWSACPIGTTHYKAAEVVVRCHNSRLSVKQDQVANSIYGHNPFRDKSVGSSLTSTDLKRGIDACPNLGQKPNEKSVKFWYRDIERYTLLIAIDLGQYG